MKRLAWLPVILLIFCGYPARSATIEEDQVRTASGVISAVETGKGILVLESPHPKGNLTVGVVMAVNARMTRAGKAIGLGDLAVGETVTLTYTRKGGRLIGTEVKAKAPGD